MRRGCVKKVLLWGLLVLGLAGVALYLWLREPPPETRFNGAYRTEDGEIAIVVPGPGQELRLQYPDRGVRRPLHPLDGDRYRVGSRGTRVPPEEQKDETVAFETAPDGRVEAVRIREEESGRETVASRIGLPEERFSFESDGYRLEAKLVLPEPGASEPPYPAAVVVHGSGQESAIDFFDDPYLFAPHGVATLVYDKRGTGRSEGTYTQNFHVLARDVLAAVETLRDRPDIDPEVIHLVGYSQGGWIAPLAAVRGGGIRSVVVGYGPMVPIIEEDRWGYVYTLRKEGFGDEAIAEADQIHELIVRVIDHGEDRWGELKDRLAEVEDEEWFRAAAESDSTVGFLSSNRWVPMWVLELYAKWMLRPIDGEPRADRLYDPVPVVAELQAPSLWIFGGEDHSMPTEWTVRELERLQERGAPIEIVVYPEADHGIVLIEESEDGEPRFLGYPPSYMPRIVEWLRSHSGLQPPTVTEPAPTVTEDPSPRVEE